jgi:hypothetical protein
VRNDFIIVCRVKLLLLLERDRIFKNIVRIVDIPIKKECAAIKSRAVFVSESYTCMYTVLCVCFLYQELNAVF